MGYKELPINLILKDSFAKEIQSDDQGYYLIERDAHNTENLFFREMEISILFKDGLASKEISSLLNIAVNTVEMHRHHILKKLKSKNTASLITLPIEPILPDWDKGRIF